MPPQLGTRDLMPSEEVDMKITHFTVFCTPVTQPYTPVHQLGESHVLTYMYSIKVELELKKDHTELEGDFVHCFMQLHSANDWSL